VLSGKVVNFLCLTEIIEIEIFCAKILKDFNSDKLLFFLSPEIDRRYFLPQRPTE